MASCDLGCHVTQAGIQKYLTGWNTGMARTCEVYILQLAIKYLVPSFRPEGAG